MRNLLFIIFLSFFSLVLAQEGKIRGAILDDFVGTSIPDANITVENSTISDVSDLDGAFTLDLPEGIYNLKINADGYDELTVESVTVTANEVTVLDELFLVESLDSDGSVDLEAAVVTGQRTRDTEEALLRVKKRSAVILDGISSARLKLTGDGNAVQAAKRVTGVSVDDGKYIIVRGLGDRYSKSLLNGIEIPGLDPDRNTIQMDIFPSDILNNILVNKTFSAELPADFTGGLVNLETKSFPTKRFLNVSVGVGFNGQANLTNDYIAEQGSQSDFLGFDDGQRDLPAFARAFQDASPFISFPAPDPSGTNQLLLEVTRSFNPELAVTNQTSLLNGSLGISYGDQFNLKNGDDIGILLSANYNNEYLVFDEAFFGNFIRDPTDRSNNELQLAGSQTGVQAENNVQIGLLAGISYKTGKSKYSLTGMHLQSGSAVAGEFVLLNGDVAGQSGFNGVTDNIEYSERGLSNAILQGEHKFGNGWFLDWKVGGTYSSADDPDVRRTPFTIDQAGRFVFSSGEAGLPTRIWRDLNEWAINPTFDFTKEYKLFDQTSKLKFGGNASFKDRSYEILSYAVNFTGNTINQSFTSANPNLVLLESNLFPNRTLGGAYITTQNDNPNSNAYKADSQLFAGYVSNEFQFSDEFKAILGLRVENYTAFHTGRDAIGANVLADDEVLNSTDFFPSANLIYSINNDMNLRGVYSRTIARPSFKELSFATIVDPFKDRIFLGGLNPVGDDWDGNLQETYINNFDVRWEYFLGRGELLSVSGFYKTFDNPIELVRVATATTTVQYQPRNVGDGKVYGIELEASKNLGFISSFLEDFLLTANYTLLESEIDMSEEEIRTRTNGLRDGETLETTRQMVGQSPFVINAGLIFKRDEIGLETGIFYNVRGRTLSVVGTGLVPDVYDRPFNDLSYTIRKSFGKEKNFTVDFRVANILDSERQSVFTSFGAQDQLYERVNPDRTYTLSVGLKF